MQKRLRKIMKLKADEREIALREYAQKLGCSVSGSYPSNDKYVEEDIVRRIQETMTSIRDSRLWLLAFISVFVFFASSFVLWFALWSH